MMSKLSLVNEVTDLGKNKKIKYITQHTPLSDLACEKRKKAYTHKMKLSETVTPSFAISNAGIYSCEQWH